MWARARLWAAAWVLFALVAPLRGRADPLALRAAVERLQRAGPLSLRLEAERARALAATNTPQAPNAHSQRPGDDPSARALAWSLAAWPDSAASAALLADQALGGGFGAGPGHRASAPETADALLTLSALDAMPRWAMRAPALALLALQRPDGGFSATGGASDLPTTALAVRALSAVRDVVEWGAGRDAALAWLDARAQLEAPTALRVALAMDARAAAGRLSVEGVAALVSLQSAPGLWGDVQGTAAAIRTLAAARPNWALRDAALDAAEVVAGGRVHVQVTVVNDGLEQLPATTLDLEDAETRERLTALHVGPLAPGERVVVNAGLNAPPAPQSWRLEARIDTETRVDERDEADNAVTLRVGVSTRAPPDLELRAEALALSPWPAEVGQPMTLRVRVRNRGDEVSDAVDLDAHLGAPEAGGAFLARGAVGPIAPHDEVEVALPLAAFERPIRGVLHVRVDPERIGRDGFRTNDRAARSLRVVGGADLRVVQGGVRIVPSAIVAVGDPVELQVAVENAGGEASVETHVSVSDTGGPALDVVTLPPLNPGEVTQVTLWVTPDEERAYTYFIEVDPEDLVVERDEVDNVGAARLRGDAWNLSAQPFADPRVANLPSAGEWSLFTNVRSTSARAVPSVQVRATLDGVEGRSLGQATCPAISGAPATGFVQVQCGVRFRLEGLAPGPHTFTLCVDATGVLAETNEQDNCVTARVEAAAAPDYGVELDVPEVISPDTVVVARARSTRPEFARGFARLRVHVDGRSVFFGQPAPGTWVSFPWRGPDARGESVWVATVEGEEPNGLVDPTQANNRVERRVQIGGEARVLRVLGRAQEADVDPLRGREARLDVYVDAPTQVTFDRLTRAAGPNAPAMFSWRPLEAGVVQVAVQLEGEAAPTLWPVVVRTDALAAPRVSAVPVEGGVEVSWPANVGEDRAYIERDGRPLGPVSAVVGGLAAADVGVAPVGSVREIALGPPRWVAGATLALGGSAGVTHGVRLLGRAEGRWRVLFAESDQWVGVLQRAFEPAQVDRVRWVYASSSLGDRGSLRPTQIDLLGPAGVASPFVDETVGAGPARYTVTAAAGELLGPSSASALVEAALGPYEVRATVEGTLARFVADADPRVAGWRIEVDGTPLSSDDLGGALSDSSLGVGAEPRVLPAEWSLRSVTPAREVWLRFPGTRWVDVAHAPAPIEAWQAFGADDTVFAPGWHRALRYFLPGEGPDPARSLTARASGQLQLDGATLDWTRALALGAHVVTLTPVDAEGRRGVESDVVVEVVDGPPALDQVAVSYDPAGAGSVVVTWAPAAVHERVEVAVDDLTPTMVAASSRRFSTPSSRGQGLWRFRLVPLDAAGNRGPPTDVAWALGQAWPEVTQVAAAVAGVRVTATWAPVVPVAGQPAVHSYAVSVDGVVVGTPLSPPFVFTEGRAGAHRLEVQPRFGAAATAGHLSPSATFIIGDDGPPPAPALLPVAQWPVTSDASFRVRWSPLNVADLARFEVEVNGEPTLLEAPAGATFLVVPWRRGVRRYDVRVRSVDATGNASAWVTARLDVPPATALTLRSTGLSAAGTLGFATAEPAVRLGGHSGYWLTRSGERLCAMERAAYTVEAPAGQGETLDLDRGVWGSRGEAPPFALDLVGPSPTGLIVDRFIVDFGREDTRAVDFSLLVLEPPSTWRVVTEVRGNVAARWSIDLPRSPRVAGARLRLRIDRVAESGHLSVAAIEAETCAAPRPLVDAAPLPGPSDYALVPWDVAGEPGPSSPLVRVDTPRIDLSIEGGAFALSEDEWQVGDTLAVVIPVQNSGSAAVDGVEVALEVAPQRCGVQARRLASARVDVPGDDIAVAVLPWSVDVESGVLCVNVDPSRAVAELVEDNNQASRAVAADLAFRTEGYSPDGLTLMPCAPETRYVVRWGAPAAVSTGTLRAGAVADLPLVRGPFTLSTDRPVVALVGPTQAVTSSLARDCDDAAVVTRATVDVPLPNAAFNAAVAAEFPSLFVWAPAQDAVLTAVEDQRRVGASWQPSGLEVLRRDISADALVALNPHTLVDAAGAPRATGLLRLESTAPIAAWSYADLGFPFVGADGRAAGTRLVGFVGRSSALARAQLEEVVIASYADENRVEVIRRDSGERVFVGLLPRFGLASVPFPHGAGRAPIPLEVRASGDVTALNMSLTADVAYGYVHALYIPGASGRMIDTAFVVPVTPNAGADDTLAVLGFYDGTQVTVTSPDTGETLISTTLQRGGAIDLLDAALLTPRLDRRRLIVQSEGPVAVFQAIGDQGAEFAPMLWSSAHRPDLRVAAWRATPASPQAGERVQVHFTVENAGARRARGFGVTVRAGESPDGPPLFDAHLSRLDAGRPAAFTFEVSAADRPQVMTVRVDPDGVVPETNEDNNVYVARMGAPLNLTATRLDAETPQVGVPGWLTVSIENTGGVPVRQAVAVVRVDGASLGRISLDATPGEVAQARLPWTPTSSGQASVSLMVDPEDALDEARRDDNALDTLVHVATAAPRSDLTVAVDEAAAARCEAVGVHLSLVPADAAEVTLTHALGEVARVRLDDDGRATWWPSDEDRARGDGWTAQTLTAQSVEFTLPPLDARCGERSTPEENAPWVTLGVTPRLALPGEPVQLEASGAGGARLELGVDGVVLGTLDAPRREDVRRAVDVSAVTGTFQAFARIVDADGLLLAERTLGFERASSGPAARLEVGVAPDRADRATPVPVQVTLSAPWPAAPMWVERVHVAAIDLDEGRVAAEADAEARLNVDAPQMLDVPLDLTREAAARLTLVATAFDALGVQLGLGAGPLTLLGAPDAALVDAGGDPALDLDAATVDAQPLDGATIDAQPLDGATVDAQPLDGAVDVDVAIVDAQLLDGATIDAQPLDMAIIDAQPLDGATIDAQPLDRDAEEQTLDAAPPRPRLRRGPTDGCGCAATSPHAASLWVALWIALGAVLRRRRHVSAGRRA